MNWSPVQLKRHSREPAKARVLTQLHCKRGGNKTTSGADLRYALKCRWSHCCSRRKGFFKLIFKKLLTANLPRQSEEIEQGHRLIHLGTNVRKGRWPEMLRLGEGGTTGPPWLMVLSLAVPVCRTTTGPASWFSRISWQLFWFRYRTALIPGILFSSVLLLFFSL